MAFEEVRETAEDIQQQTQEYLEQSEAYIKLKIFQVLMKIVIGSVQTLVLGLLCSIIFLLISIGLAVYLGDIIENSLAGYLIVAAAYLIIGIILYLLRNSLNKKLISRFSTIFFEQE